MGIKIDIPGLNKYISEIPDKQIILIEGKLDPIKTYFVTYLGSIANKNGHKVVFITSRVKEEIEKQLAYYGPETKDFEIIEERSARHWEDYISKDSVLIIDSFSYLMLGKSLYEFRDLLEDLRKKCKQERAIVLLTVVDGMLEEKQEITVEYLADGIIRFLTRESPKGIARFVRIPRWHGYVSFDDNIHYTFDGDRMKVDLRSRVT